MWKKFSSLHISETSLVLAARITILTVAIITLYSQDLMVIFSDALQSEITSYMLAVPFLLAYLIYRKRKMLKAVAPLKNVDEPKETRHLPLISGVLLSMIAMLLYWYGSYTFTPLEYHMLTLPILTAGLTLILFNPQTLRQLAFPIIFLLFLTPPPSEILYAVGSTLSVISSEAANAVVKAFGIPSTLTNEYSNPTITLLRSDGTPINFTVDIACSGIYSLIGFLIFAVFVAYIIRDRIWKKLAIIMSGIPLIYSLNITRITIILMIGYYLGEELALQIFHLIGGWILIYFGTLLLLAVSEKIFKTQIFAKSTEKCSHYSSKSKIAENFCLLCGRILKPADITINKTEIVKIAAIASAVILLMSIQTPVFALTQAQPIVIFNTSSGQQVSTDILPKIANYTLSFFSRDTQFEAIAKQDMALIYLYSSLNDSEDYVWVTIEIASTRSSLHRWEACLITWPMLKGYQPKVTQIILKDIQIIQNPPVISRYFVFNYTSTGLTQAVLYWYETSTFKIESAFQSKYVKISLIAYPENMEQLSNTEKKLVAFAREIAAYWQPIKTWSQITMILSQNGMILASISTIILTAVIFLYLIEMRRQKRFNINTYLKLSKPNRQIIDAVKEAEKQTTPTLNNIASTYQRATGQKISAEQLLKILSEIEKTGVIKRSIANRRDEPMQVWKTR